MPKNRKKGGAGCKNYRSFGDKSDVTLNDFANSTGKGGRLKKSASNATVHEVKRMVAAPLKVEEDTDIAWFDKDLDEFDVDFQPQPAGDQEDDCDITRVSRRTRSKKKRVPKRDNPEGGVEYPLDVWFILSEYIRPEDTASFAAICRSTRLVVDSHKFWSCLYKRYYDGHIQLPIRLQPECMDRPHSLRACVVRALFFVYPSFVERLRNTAPFSSEPHSLVSEPCRLVWHRHNQISHVWDFFFKFHNGHTRSSLPPTTGHRQPDLLDMLGDVHANSEEGCRVLQVTCLNFVSVPPVMGMHLADVNLNVGHKMKHKLRLTFSATPYFNRQSKHRDGTLTVTCDPVSNIRVLDWWHPQYPYRDLK